MAEADVWALAAAFGRAVREADISCSSERSVRFARALTLEVPTNFSQLYWTARTIFVSSREQIPVFDRVFALHFIGAPEAEQAPEEPGSPVPTSAPPESTDAQPQPVLEGAPAKAHQLDGLDNEGTEGEPATELALAAASADERLAEKDFAALDDGELLAMRALMADLSLATPRRLSRRSRRDRHGNRLDLRATLRAGTHTGGDPARQLRRRRRRTPRRLIVLCDISGSIEPYARAFLQFLGCAAGGADAEAFVFATRLTRLTRELKGAPSADLALSRAAAAAPDWSSGTLIGKALQAFNDLHGRRGMAHGAVVVILSDGWDRGDPALVAREMERLRRLAYRIVWVNPRRAGRDYAPLAGGMAAALPSCDAFVSGNSLGALAAVAEAIADTR